ncbi:hypothetical protein R83H12_00675 [Fibrobacteria bacterium R8-3-H12]
MREIEFNKDNTQIGFRLDYMELLNWGTFNNGVWQIKLNGNNSLLTGGIGSGKSTIVDALTCLIVPHNKIIFNKAAGAENKERTLLSYIRGEYKNTKSEYNDIAEKRKGKPVGLRYDNENNMTFTVILANFHNVGYSSNITLVQVFWIENEKVQKLFIISTKALRIKETFENIEDGKILKQRIKSLSNIKYSGDKFLEYSQKFRHEFGMNSEKAIDLFYQTVSMKSVSSLTSFVREQMLEQTDVKTQIDDLKTHFDDLNRAYDAVKEVRRRRDALHPLIDLNKNYNNYKQQIEEIDNILSAIPSYFASKKITLLEEEIKSWEAKLNQINNQLEQIKIDLTYKNKVKNQIKQDIYNNGGARLEKITEEIEQHEKAKTSKKEKYEAYASLLILCSLPIANADRTFYSNLKVANEKIELLKEIYTANTKELGKKTEDLRMAKKNVEKAEIELASLRSRKNQIPLSFLDIRQQLAVDLQIDENKIPFVGELIKVKEEEKQWEGALERLLHGFGISLLVPEEYYKQVSEYINAKKMSDRNQKGIKLDYFPIFRDFKPKNQPPEIAPDSVVNKIEINNNPVFKGWLQADLERHFNLRCVSMEEFQKIRQDAITLEGQFKKGKKHTKDDRTELWDRTKFVLGWSNIEKRKAIEYDLENNLKPKYNSIESELENLKKEIDNNLNLNNNFNKLIVYQNWNELNWQDEVKAIENLKQEELNITTSSNILQTLQKELEKNSAEITKLETEQTIKNQSIGNIENKLENCNTEIENCKTTQNTDFKNEREIYYPKIDKQIENITLTYKNADRTRDDLINKYNGKTGEKERLNKKLESVRDAIIKNMSSYKKDFPADTMELSDEIESLPEYIQKYEEIVTEGLPEHENRFKEMLKKTTIEDISIFDNKLESHSKQIKKKIDEINKHLKEIEFNKGTYIELSVEPNNSDKEIGDFKKDLQNCFDGILDVASDAYNEDRFAMVKKILDRFMSNDNKNMEWTKKVTDVRNWFLFGAIERSYEDNNEKEYYSDSAGKSGGQKEKLAYTILASALAYQFGLVHGEPRSRSFRFVVIDEAFGRGDDESTQFGLELFKKLNLQLLVVTPFQKIHIIENYVKTVHIVSNAEGNNSEIQYVTAEEYKQKKQERNLINNPKEIIQ